MVDNLGRRTVRCLLATTAAALAMAPAALANDADLDPAFGSGGTVFFNDPFEVPLPRGGEPQTFERNQALQTAVDAEGRILVLAVRTVFTRGDEQPINGLVRLTRLTPAGQPDPTFNGGGLPGESASLVDDSGGFLQPRSMTVLPDGSILLGSVEEEEVSKGRGPLSGGNTVVLTKITPTGALDTSYGDGSDPDSAASRRIFVGCGADVLSAAFRPDGKLSVFVSQDSCDRGNGGPHDQLLVLNQDGSVDENASEIYEQDKFPDGGLVVGFGAENGQVVTYAGLGSLAGGGWPDSTQLVKFGADGVRDLTFGGTKGGIVEIPGGLLRIEATKAGAPQVLTVVRPQLEERGTGLEDASWRVTRLTSAGLPDSNWATNGVIDHPFLRPDLGEGYFQYLVGMTIDAKDRTHLIGNILNGFTASAQDVRSARGFGSDTTDLRLLVVRLAANGTRDASFGEVGERLFPNPPDQVAFVFYQIIFLLSGIDSEPQIHQADGKLLIPYLGIAIQDVDPARGVSVRGSRAVMRRLTGTAVDPVVTPPAPPAPPAPAAPAQAVQGAAAKKPRTCRSRRAFTVRLRPKRARLRSAVVTVNGKRVKVRKGRRFTAQINLKGRVPATIRVRIVAKDTRGRTHRETRTYRTCRYAGRPLKDITVS